MLLGKTNTVAIQPLPFSHHTNIIVILIHSLPYKYKIATVTLAGLFTYFICRQLSHIWTSVQKPRKEKTTNETHIKTWILNEYIHNTIRWKCINNIWKSKLYTTQFCFVQQCFLYATKAFHPAISISFYYSNGAGSQWLNGFSNIREGLADWGPPTPLPSSHHQVSEWVVCDHRRDLALLLINTHV